MSIRNSIHARLLCRCGAICLTAFMCAGGVSAAVVLDTFEPGTTATGPDWAVFGGAQAQSLAVRFSLGRPATVVSALLALEVVGEARVGVMGDAAGLPSALFLHDARVTDTTFTVALSGLAWALPAGDYWLATVIEDDGAFGIWTGGDAAAATWAWTSAPHLWSPASAASAPAARLATSAVPLPAPLLLLSVALLGLVPRRSRQPG